MNVLVTTGQAAAWPHPERTMSAMSFPRLILPLLATIALASAEMSMASVAMPVLTSASATTISASYNFALWEGKWCHRGSVTFFGNRESDWVHDDLLAIDGERGNGSDMLKFVCNEWTRMGDAHVVVYRVQVPGITPPYKFAEFDMHGGTGTNGQFSLSLH